MSVSYLMLLSFAGGGSPQLRFFPGNLSFLSSTPARPRPPSGRAGPGCVAPWQWFHSRSDTAAFLRQVGGHPPRTTVSPLHSLIALALPLDRSPEVARTEFCLLTASPCKPRRSFLFWPRATVRPRALRAACMDRKDVCLVYTRTK